MMHCFLRARHARKYLAIDDAVERRTFNFRYLQISSSYHFFLVRWANSKWVTRPTARLDRSLFIKMSGSGHNLNSSMSWRPADITDLSCDFAYVASIRPTTPAPHIDVRKPKGQTCHLSSQFLGVAIFEVTEFAQIQRLHCNSIRHEAIKP